MARWGARSARDEKLIRQIEAGAKRAWAAVRNGTGGATVYKWRRDPGGRLAECETRCKVAFAGQRFKIDYADVFKRAASPKDPLNQRAGRLLRRVLNRAYSNQTLEAGIGASDGKTSTVYRRNIGNAVESTARDPRWIEHSEVVTLCRGAKPIREGSRKAYPDGLTQTGGAIRIVGRERVDGSDCIVLEQERTATYQGRVMNRVVARLWVCPALGYAVPRVQTWGRSPEPGLLMLWAESRTRFRKYGRGLWGPAEVEWVYYHPGGSGVRAGRKKVTYEPGFRLNVPAKSLDLKLHVPSGTKVFNLETGGFRKIP